ncbi:MAG: multidrug efflux MFS transporter [Chloroflexi bacterium]|nr:multidrug efflux MFS transporter [Chloroflexota bacterium]
MNKNSEEKIGIAFWDPLIAAALALFIVVVDSTMMNVTVPTIVKDLKTSVTSVQSVISLYLLGMAVNAVRDQLAAKLTPIFSTICPYRRYLGPRRYSRFVL